MKQQILFISTLRDDVRSEAVGWACDDSSLVVPGLAIEFTPAPRFRFTYDCVLRALADGWQCLGQPERFVAGTDVDGRPLHQWYWMLSRMVEA